MRIVCNWLIAAGALLILVCPARASEEESTIQLPKAGYVTRSGAFRLDGQKGEGLYIRPGTHRLYTAKLKLYGVNERVWWYREQETAYFLGFAGTAGDCDYPVFWGYWDTNGNWHGFSLGSARRVPPANVAMAARPAPPAETPFSGPYIRYDARSSNGKRMLKIYAEAVAKMKATNEGDPESWTYQWYTHWTKGSTTKAKEIKRIYPASNQWSALAEEMWDTCQAHGGEDENDFLPWHRMFVYYFEKIIRDVSGEQTFTLPYWNYSTSDASTRGVIPPEFIKPTDAVFQSLFVDKRKPAVNQGKPIQQGQPGDPLSLSALAQCMYEPSGNVAGFCMELDSGLHGNVHVLVGNSQNMGSVPWAAYDPIFWLHHCNIDRLWASWNAAGRVNPSLTATFVFAQNKQRVVAKDSDFMDTKTLGYSYDHLEPAPQCPTPRPKLIAAAQAFRGVAAVKKEIKLGPEPVRVPLEPIAPTKGAEVKAFGERLKMLPEGKHLYLVVKNLRADMQPGVLYHLYLDLPKGASAEQAKGHYVGALNFFNAVKHREMKHKGTKNKTTERFYTFDITALARALHSRNALKEAPVLSIAPAGEPATNANPIIGEITVVEQ